MELGLNTKKSLCELGSCHTGKLCRHFLTNFSFPCPGLDFRDFFNSVNSSECFIY